jgi:cell division protein ZapA (FtsZ GTPase activity inhibitor)
MSEENLIPINVWLAGRSYRIRIKAEEEEAVRKAVKLADEKVLEMRSQYAGKDDQDFLAMCLLMYAADSAIDNNSNPLMQNEISQMIKRIDSVLSQES